MMSKQIQEGGDNSSNYQAREMTVNVVGIDEKRAREIYKEMNLQVKEDFTKEALEVAKVRVTEFENSLMHKMENVEGALEAFADPSFQLLLVEAQKTAAATERTVDYDMLSELLVYRFQKGENRTIWAGISRAVEVIDEIADDALLGLTAFHAVHTFFPTTGDIQIGLDVLDKLFGNIFYGKLPVGRDWLDHLDILNAVRLDSFNGMKKIDDYYPEQLCGYIDAGIKKDSEDFTKAVDILKANDLPLDILVIHVLNPEFVRLYIPDRHQIGSITISKQELYEGQLIQRFSNLSEKQKDAVNMVYDLYDKDINVKKENIRLFMESWDERVNLVVLKDWWNGLDAGVQITSVGRVLAHSNAQRCDKNLPPFE